MRHPYDADTVISELETFLREAERSHLRFGSRGYGRSDSGPSPGSARDGRPRWLAAVHEAGHGVVAMELWPRNPEAVTRLMVHDDGGGSQRGTDPQDATEFDRLVVFLAGPCAVEMRTGDAKQHAYAYQNDLESAERVFRRRILDEEAGLAWLTCWKILEKRTEVVFFVAKALDEHGELSGDRVRELYFAALR